MNTLLKVLLSLVATAVFAAGAIAHGHGHEALFLALFPVSLVLAVLVGAIQDCRIRI